MVPSDILFKKKKKKKDNDNNNEINLTQKRCSCAARLPKMLVFLDELVSKF